MPSYRSVDETGKQWEVLISDKDTDSLSFDSTNQGEQRVFLGVSLGLASDRVI